MSGRRWTASSAHYIRAEIAKIAHLHRVQDLGQRLPPRHLVDQAGQDAGRSEGLQGARAGRAAADLAVHGARRRPTPINFNEVYTALQTKVVEGQENPLAIIARRGSTRSEELQPDGPCLGRVLGPRQPQGDGALAQGRPGDHPREIDKSATDQRADIAALSVSLRPTSGQGRADDRARQEGIQGRAGQGHVLQGLRAKFGDEAWKLLQDSVGNLG